MQHATIRIRSRGQIVIPAAIRSRLHLAPGDELVVEVAADERSIILRAGLRREIEEQLETGYRWLEETGDDPVAALHQARDKERERGRRRPRARHRHPHREAR